MKKQIKKSIGYVPPPTTPSGLTFEKVWDMFQETNKTIDRLSVEIGGVSRSVGKMIENFMFDSMESALLNIGAKKITVFSQTDIYKGKEKMTDLDCGAKAVWKGEEVAFLFECKSSLTRGDMKKFEDNKDYIVNHLSLYNRKIYLMFAYNKITEDAKKYALEKDFFCYRIGGDGNVVREK